jgi:DNA-directed RNA polymerase specialized sigma24 family protein
MFENAKTRTKRSQDAINWPEVDDAALVAAMIANDNGAWRELARRYGGTIDGRIRFVISMCDAYYKSSDTFDDIKSEFHVALLANDRARLHQFDATRAPLATWLSLIAQQTAAKHLVRVARRPIPDEVLAQLQDREGESTQPRTSAGGRWIAEGL